jgi:outer membrane protein assembly factor BamD
MRAKLLILLMFFATGCVSYDQYDTSTAEGAFGMAQALEKDERYEESLLQYKDLKNRFPYSKYATQAELQVAEIQFKKEAYPEAQGAYQLFKELHPKHPQTDYVTFRIGESLFKQLPSSIDRDLSLAPIAIKEFDVLIRDYPNSTYITEGKKLRNEVIGQLASKELYIADFYFRTKAWQHALVRYEKYLKEFPTHDKRPHAYFNAGKAAAEFGEDSKKNKLLRSLVEEFPNSTEAQKAKRLL